MTDINLIILGAVVWAIAGQLVAFLVEPNSDCRDLPIVIGWPVALAGWLVYSMVCLVKTVRHRRV